MVQTQINEYVYSPTDGSRQIHTINNTKDKQRTEMSKSNTTLILKIQYDCQLDDRGSKIY